MILWGKKNNNKAGIAPAEAPPFVFQAASLLQRSKSFCQTDIEKLLDGEDGSNQLIGDFTKVRKETGGSSS